RDLDLEDVVLHVLGLDARGQLRPHAVLVAGVGVDDVPLADGGAQLALEGRQLVLCLGFLGVLGFLAPGRLGVLACLGGRVVGVGCLLGRDRIIGPGEGGLAVRCALGLRGIGLLGGRRLGGLGLLGGGGGPLRGGERQRVVDVLVGVLGG